MNEKSEALPIDQHPGVQGLAQLGRNAIDRVIELEQARARDNVAFKQLLAQRDALLEALDQCLNGTLIGGHTHNDNGLEVLAQRCGAPHIANELRRLANIARAAIKKAEEGK